MRKIYQPLAGLAVAAALLFPAIAQAAVPPKLRTPSEWAKDERFIVSESGSRFSGKWDPDLIPFLDEVMDACGPDDPSTEVTAIASAQSGKSTVGENCLGFYMQDRPCGIGVVLPSFDEADKYSELKLDNMIKASPGLSACVARTGVKGGSKVRRKSFRGGFLQLFSATADKNLQMVTCGFFVNEEIAGWPRTAGDRGDVLSQIEARGTTFGSKFKMYNATTPAKSGTCRGTERYNLGDQRLLFWNCTQCHDWFHLRLQHLTRFEGRAVCFAPCCGAMIEHRDKFVMGRGDTASGHPKPKFIPCFPSLNDNNPLPFARDENGEIIDWVIRAEDFAAARRRPTEGRNKSFRWWQGMVPLPDSQWMIILDKHDAAQGDPEKLATFSQQVLGEAFEAAANTPPHKALHKMRGGAPRQKSSPVVRGHIPPWAGFVTIAADLQGNRGEWGAFAHGPGRMCAMIDHGVIYTPPLQPKFWRELSTLFARQWPSNHLRPQIAVKAGVDTGGMNTQEAYRFVRANPDVHGIQGMKGARARFNPPVLIRRVGKIKTPNGRVIEQKVELTQLNTHLWKKLFYIGLNNALDAHEADEVGEGVHIFTHADTELAIFEQMTAEHLIVDKSRDIERWERISDSRPNEMLDIGCYNLALADIFGASRMTDDDWLDLFRRESIDASTVDIGPLEQLMREPEAPIQIVDTTPRPKAPAWMVDGINRDRT